MNKTISLDEETALIADKLPNFSRFVRQSLLNLAGATEKGRDAVHYAPPEARIWGPTNDKCNPKHRKGECPTCWGSE